MEKRNLFIEVLYDLKWPNETNRHFALRLGFDHSNLTHWEKNPGKCDPIRAINLLRSQGVEPETISKVVDYLFQNRKEKLKGDVKVRLIFNGREYLPGYSSPRFVHDAEDDKSDSRTPFIFRNDLISKFQSEMISIAQIQDDAMFPDFKHRDFVMFDESNRNTEDGAFFWVNINGEDMPGRVIVEDGDVMINAGAKHGIVSITSPILRLYGRIVWAGRFIV